MNQIVIYRDRFSVKRGETFAGNDYRLVSRERARYNLAKSETYIESRHLRDTNE